MKWFLLVTFVNLETPAFMFTTPMFDSQQECKSSAQDPEKIPTYVLKLVEAYGSFQPINSVMCINETHARELFGFQSTNDT